MNQAEPAHFYGEEILSLPLQYEYQVAAFSSMLNILSRRQIALWF